MPTYEYRCDRCSHEFELFQKISEPPVKVCPQCGGPVKRKIGPGSGLIFKGSGFYATDYRSADYRARATSEKGGGGSTAKGDAGKTDAGKKDAGKKDAGRKEPKPKAGDGASGPKDG